MQTVWESRYAQRNQRMGRSIIRELLKFTMLPDVISFAGGLPAPELFPTQRCSEAACRLLVENGELALQYGPTEGYLPLREFICEQMASIGVKIMPANVLITNGSQQALDLVGKLLINPGDRVLVEEPTYLGALQAWNAYQAEYIGAPIDDDGICTDQLEPALRAGPKFMYILPNFQNPAGTTLSLNRRAELLALSARYGIPMIEDDPYGALRFEGQDILPLIAMDENVIYLGTLSKTLAPGLRLGWVAGPEAVISQLVMAKQGTDLHTSTFTQMLAYEIVKDGFIDNHIQEIRRVYGERRMVMLQAMERYFPEGCSWTRPQGGLFLWARVPEWIDTAGLLNEAVQAKVAYVPGFAFYADPAHGQNTMRLNFSNAKPAQIEEGIRRLGDLLKQVVARQAHPAW